MRKTILALFLLSANFAFTQPVLYSSLVVKDGKTVENDLPGRPVLGKYRN